MMRNSYRFLNLFTLVLCFCAVSMVNGQGFYFDPSPTDVSSPARLYIDITSADCNCPELLDADPDTNPLYIWTWDPNEQRPPLGSELIDVTNGEWNNSNDNLILQQDPVNPNLWFFDYLGFSVAEFYAQPAAVFYDTGINFLLKEKDGGANAEGAEQKSPDMNIVLEPLGCFEKVCPFPETFFQDQYFVITYDNNKETVGFLQNMGADECLIWYRISVNGGPTVIFREETDKFKMTFDGDGIFSLSMIPQDYFELTDGDVLSQIDVFITKTPINVPPFTAPLSLIPGCE